MTIDDQSLETKSELDCLLHQPIPQHLQTERLDPGLWGDWDGLWGRGEDRRVVKRRGVWFQVVSHGCR